jgi:uncharacterized phage-associated protein
VKHRQRVVRASEVKESIVTNQTISKKFLSLIDVNTLDEILSAVAKHYGITKTAAFEEITHEEAEHLLDYLTGAVRTATSILMSKHSLVAS